MDAELLRGLLNEIAGDCRVAYGVTEESYRAYCRNGAVGAFPADTWAVHCQRRLGQIEKALASLSVAQGQGWRPIESAPRDGTRVLLGRPDDDGDGGVSTCGYWLDGLEDGQDYMGHDAGFTDVDYQCFQPGRSFGNEAYRYAGRQPTHWQPLPAAPAQPDGVSK